MGHAARTVSEVLGLRLRTCAGRQPGHGWERKREAHAKQVQGGVAEGPGPADSRGMIWGRGKGHTGSAVALASLGACCRLLAKLSQVIVA